MPKIIAVEGHGNLQFGDEWSDEQIDQYLTKQFSQPTVPAPAPQPERQGVLSSFKSGLSKGFESGGIPFYSGGKELVKATGVLKAALDARSGNATDEQIAELEAYKAEEERAAAEAANRSTGERIAYGVGRVVGELPGFAGELAATGGIATAGEKAAIKATAAGIRALGTESAYAATRKAAELASKNAAGRIIRGVTGAAAQTIPARGLQIAAGAAERMTPEFSLESTPEGTYFTTENQGDDFLDAAYKSLGDQFIETLSERSGGFITDMLGAGAKKAGLGTAIDWASGLKQAVANRVAQKYPGILGENTLLDAVRNTTKWNGMFGEMLEERAGEVGRAAIGVDEYRPPSMEQLAIEALGFGLVDAGYNSARLASAMSRSRADAKLLRKIQDAVSEAEAARGQQAPDTLSQAATAPTAETEKPAYEWDRARNNALWRKYEAGTITDSELAEFNARTEQNWERPSFTQAAPASASANAVTARNAVDRIIAEARADEEAKANARMEQERAAAQSRSRSAIGDATQRLSEMESAAADRFGPGARGEVPQTLSDAGTDIMQRLRLIADAEAKARAAAEAARVEAARVEAARAEAEAKARAEAEAARTKISPPTDISLPADTGAPSTGGVQTGAPVLPSNQADDQVMPGLSEAERSRLYVLEMADKAGSLPPEYKAEIQSLRDRSKQPTPSVTQGQAPAASPAPAIQPAKTKAPRRAANAPTAQGKALATTAPAPAPVYKDGAEVKVGDYVRINKLVGQTKIYGTVSEIRDGTPMVTIKTIGKGQSGTKQSEKSGLQLGDTVAVSKKGAFLTKEENKNEKIAAEKKAKESQKTVEIDDEQKLINQGAEDELFPRFADLISRAANRDKEAQVELSQLRDELDSTPEGRMRAIGIEAAVRVANIEASLQMQAQANKAFDYDTDVAGRDYLQEIKRWIRKSVNSEEVVQFSPSKAANTALRNAIKKRTVDKRTVSLSSSTDLDGSDSSPIDQIAAAETGTESSGAPIGVAAAPSTSARSILALFGKRDILNKLADLIAGSIKSAGLEGAVKSSVTEVLKPYVGNNTNQGVLRVIDDISEQAFERLQEFYDEGGVPAVREATMDGTLTETLNASINAADTGNQSLPAGELTLDQAINTVLQTEPEGSLLRAIADKLLKAGVTARVIVLSDDAFSQLGTKPDATAFYESDPAKNTIYVRQSAQSHDYLVMHEAVHAATVYALRTNVAFRNDISRLRSQAIAALGSNSYGLQEYGSNFKNLSEFVAEALSSREFQQALAGVKSGNQTLWEKFKALLAKIFRVSGNEKTLLDAVIESTSEGFAPNVATAENRGTEVLNAAPRISSEQKRQALLSVPGLQSDNVRAIENLAATQAQMVPQSAITMLGSASQQTKRRLAWLDRQAKASPNPAALSSLMTANPTYSEVEEFAEAAHGVDKVARDIERNRERAEKRLADLQDKFSNIGSLKAELSTAQGNADAIKAIGESMLDDYETYIRDRANLAGKLTAAEQASLTNASEVVRRVRKESNEMRKAMDTIASVVPEAVVNSAATNDDLINYITTNNVLDGKVDANTIAFLMTPGASGNTPLQSFKRLIPAVRLIQKIKKDSSALNQSIDAYENAFAAAAGNKVRKVSARAFAKRFAKLDAKRAEILDEARLLNSQINRLTRDVVSAQEEVDIYDEIVNSPEYRDQVETAIKQLNILTGGHREGGAEGNPTDRKITYQVGSDPKNRFEINFTTDPVENEKNKSTVLAALAAIDVELQTATDPYEIFKLKWMQMKLARHGHQMTDAAIGINPFDIVNRVRVMTPFLRPLIDRMFVFRQIPGAMGAFARTLAKVGMSMSSQIEAAKKHPVYGEAAINAAVQKAINSHGGMDPQVWDKEVLNELLGANQERTGRNMRAGETTIFGHKITPEDVAAADLQARFADAMYRVAKGAERGGIAMHFPTLVQETYTVNGEKRIRFRYAYAGGALTTPRSYDRSELPDSPVAMSKEWIDAEVPGDPAATQAAREALLQDPNFLTRFAVAHVAEMNPEYDRKSVYNAAYLALADHYAKTGSYPKTFDQLVDDIDNRLSMPAPAARSAEIKAQLIREITSFIEAYRNDLIGAAANDRDAALRNDALSAGAVGEITSASNNFTKPRGKMIAPTNFHTYTLSSDSSRGSIAHGVMLPLRRRQMESMQNILRALEATQQEMLKELKKVKNPRDYVSLRFGEGKRRVTAKQAYVTYGQLTDLINQMSTSLEVFQTMLAKPVIGSGQTSFFEDALQLRRIALVAQITSATMNYVQAVLSGQFVPRSYLVGAKPRAAITQSILGIATGAFNTAAYIASNNKAVSAWLQANKKTVIPVLKQFASVVDQIQKMKVRARAEGFGAEELSLSEQAEIIRNVGSFNSPVEGFNDSQNYISAGMDKLFSKWWFPNVALFIQNIPASADRAANILTMMQIDRAVNDVVRSGYSIMENRSKTGASGWDNWTDPNNAISEDEAAQAGWSKETLIRMRQAFSGFGGVEAVLHDYWKRVNAAKAAGKNINDVPPVADEGFYMDVTREVLGLSNAAMDSMRPDATRSRTVLSKIYNFVFTFTSWVNGWFSGLGTLVGVDRTRGTLDTVAVSALSMALLAVLLGISGLWANEIRGLMYELVKGRPYSVIRLGDVARDLRPETIAKLFGASAALMVPYAGESIASLVGAQNYRSSMTDIANLSQPLQLANTFSQALMNGARTGDWTGTFLQTLRGVVPGADMVVNRLPSMAARDAVNDASRVARVAAGPLELSERSGSGSGAQPTRFSNLIKRAEAAMAGGDRGEAQRLLNEAAQEKQKQGSTDPWGAVKSAIQGRDVDQRTFGRKLTGEERAGLMSRMSDEQRQIYTKAADNLTNLKGLVPATGERGDLERVPKTGGSKKTETAIDRVNKKLTRVRKAARPKALKVVNKKLKALKPKKLKVSGGKAASGSRLLRPRARAKGASVLLPSVS